MVQQTILKIFIQMMNHAVASDSEWTSSKLGDVKYKSGIGGDSN